MYGTREEFPYVVCPDCGGIYIESVPGDLDRHYPSHYYSLAPPSDRPLVRSAKRLRGRHALGHRTTRGAILQWMRGPPDYVRWAATAGVTPDSAILDIGAGGGHRVFNMTEAGFSNVSGVEPYLDDEVLRLSNGAIVTRSMPDDGSRFDLVMMHHSYEHMPDPLGEMKRVASLLKPGGTLLLRVPVARNYAWRIFGPNWVQLDPPRHLVLHTERSIKALAGSAGMVVMESFYDSTAFQFWGSEMYADDVPLIERAGWLKKQGYRRGRRKLRDLNAHARRLNQLRDGDQAAFFLRRR